MPDSLDSCTQKITDADYYACTFCGYTEKLEPVIKYTCPECNKSKWVKASNKKRVQ